MKDIDGFTVAESGDLKPVIEAFGRLASPLPAAAASAFAEELGWAMTREHAAQTSFPITWAEAAFVPLNDQFDEVKFNVSDSLPLGSADDPAGQARVKAAFASVREAVRTILGEPDGYRGGDFPTEWWNLDSGGRVHVLRLSRSVMLQLLSKGGADLEREEARQGISPDRTAN